MDRTRIRIFEQDGWWYTEWNGSKKGEIISLFGTNILPTAYTTGMSKSEVIRLVQEKNPRYEVY